jgi:putative aldouronate transport system substrate-binding protein
MNEMTLKFIMGQEPISNFDNYVAQIKQMGIDSAIKIKQDALERFNKR